MSQLASDLTVLLVRELETAQQELALFPDEETVWATLPGVTNSAGNLAAHLAGNLQHFIGAGLGHTGYVRDRALEFNRRSGPRAELTADLQKAIDMLRYVLPRLGDDVFARPYPDQVGGRTIRTGRFLMHLAAHAAFHVGQIGYLRRALTGDGRSSGAVSLDPLV